MLFALLAVVGTILAIGFQNIASATPEQVNFNPVTIRNGAKIHVNGDKTLTAIDNGNKLVADNTNGTAVKGNQIESELNSFATNNYGDDALFKSSVADNPVNLSEAEIKAFRNYLPTTDADYWLSNTGSKGSISYQEISKTDNTFYDNTLTATGKIDEQEYDQSLIAHGSYEYNKDVSLESYTSTVGGVWDFSSTGKANFDVHHAENDWWVFGVTFYNNPYLLNEGADANGNEFKDCSTSYNFRKWNGIFGYVSGGNRILQVQTGQVLPAGTVIVWHVWDLFVRDELGGYFKRVDNSTYLGFVRANNPVKVGGKTGESRLVTGIDKYYSGNTPVTGVNIESATKNIRASYALNNSKVAFSRSANSTKSLSVSDTLSDQPSSYINKNDDCKAVLKDKSVSIASSLSADKIATEKSSSGHADVKFDNNTIYVPYGAKKLTIRRNSFNTSNANYISVLATYDTTKKYSVLGTTDNNLVIELGSLFNNTAVGSSSTISFYAEQANDANISDLICETPVTVNVEVVEGPEQTVQYDLDGGLGTKPDSVSVKAGSTCTLENGTGLSKDGSQFRGWKLSFTNFGDTDETIMYVKGNEAFVVPDTINGKVIATAVYSGLVAHKDTNSKSSVTTIKWDSNAPEGGTAIFNDTDGIYNEDKSIKFNKIKVANAPITIPLAPTLTGVKKIFDGWYDAPVGGNKLEGLTVSTSEDKTYYAQWLDGYKVTYDASGGDGALMSGVFSNGASKVEEIVMPNDVIQGPMVGGKAESPTATDEFNGYFFAGWFTKPNGMGEPAEFGTTTVGESITYYASYLNTTFLARASQSTANPRTIEGTKYSINYLKTVAQDLVEKEKAGDITKSEYYTQFDTWGSYHKYSTIKKWDESKTYHLYTLLKDSSGNFLDPDKSDNWAEFRILQCGQNENDGAGLTFMAVHSLTKAYRMNASNTNSGGWASTELRPKMQPGGEIYKQFDEQLTSNILNITNYNKGKLWLISYTEASGATAYTKKWEGARYRYNNWRYQEDNTGISYGYARSGNDVSGTGGVWWLRSQYGTPNFTNDEGFNNCYNGDVSYMGYASIYRGVVPCFSL